MPTKFLERPQCICFKPSASGLGDKMTNTVAADMLVAMNVALINHHICPEAYFITAVKTVAMLLDSMAYLKCEQNTEAADKLRHEWLGQLPEAVTHYINEIDHELANAKGALQ